MTNIESLLEENSRQEIDEDTYNEITGKEVESHDHIDCYMYSPHPIQRLADELSLNSRPDYVVKIESESERYFTIGGQHLADIEKELEETTEPENTSKKAVLM